MPLDTAWPEEGPPVLWRREIGPGFSGIIVGDNWLFTCNGGEDSEYLTSLAPKTGELLWQTPLNTLFEEEYGDGPRATPAYDGTHVFALGSRGQLHAVEAISGKTIWQRDLYADFGGGGLKRGYASSPLLVGERLFIHIGPKSAVVCLNKSNGQTRWSKLSGRAGSSSPIAIKINGEQQIISFIGQGVYGLDPKDGRVLWHQEWSTQYGLNIADPLYVEPDRLFVSSGYDKGSGMFQFDSEGKTKELWTYRLFRNHFSSSIVFQGHIYGFDNQLFKCLNAENGEEVWKARGYGKGSMLLVGDLLLVISDKGRLSLMQATTEHKILAEHQLFKGKAWTAPSFHNGVLYVRNQNELFAIALSPTP